MDNKIKDVSILYRSTIEAEKAKEKIKAARLLMANREHQKAIDLLLSVYNSSDDEKIRLDAAALMGDLHSRPKSPVYNKTLADEYLQMTITKNHPEAMYVYGMLCVYGNSYIMKSVENGINWLIAATKAGSIEAYYELGNAYYNHMPATPENAEKSIYYFKKGAEANDSLCVYSVGEYYIRTGKYELAVENFKKALTLAKVQDENDVIRAAGEMIDKYSKYIKNTNQRG